MTIQALDLPLFRQDLDLILNVNHCSVNQSRTSEVTPMSRKTYKTKTNPGMWIVIGLVFTSTAAIVSASWLQIF